MARLVSFGCSITYGHGLPDCFIPPLMQGPTPSEYAWPALVSNKLGLENINNSRCGSSNQRILNDLLSFNFKEDDTVVILWTYYRRSLLWETDTVCHDILPNPKITWNSVNTNLNQSEEYYRVHGDYDMFTQTLLSMSHANLFLSSRNIKIHNFYFDIMLNKSINMYSYLSTAIKDCKLNYMNLLQFKVDKALDESHPGILSHKRMSSNILNNIKE